MRRITHSQYLELVAGAAVLERDRHGEKVLRRPDGLFVKVFRRKRWLSTATFFPYARRFVRNARELAERGVATVRIVDAVHCPAVARHLVTYQPLPGITLRAALLSAGADRFGLIGAFARYVATLHQKGVYFRSLHFGNVIVAPAGAGLGLIDVADLRCAAGPLPVSLRGRNFGHMLRYREDCAALREYGWAHFLDSYLAAAALPPAAERQFLANRGRFEQLFPATEQAAT